MIRSLLAAASLAAVAGAATAAGSDPYGALKAMDGHWTVTAGSGRTREVDNSCARTGLFFVCEQSVAGKPAALVVFRPMHPDERKLVYRVQTLTAGGDRPGPWRELTIDDDTWTIADLEKSGHKQRTVITHSGPDYMHVEVQAEAKEDGWKTVSTESYQRAP